MNQSVSVICIHRSSKCILQQSANETTIETTNTTVASSRRCSILVSHFEFLASVFDLFPIHPCHPSDIYPLQVGVCVRRTMNIRNGIKPTIQATDLTCNATQLATCNLQLVYRRLLVLLLKSLLATRLSATSRTSTLLLPSPLRSLLSAACSTSSLISSCGGTTASDDDPPANTK